MKFILEGLDCSNCAMKIENELKDNNIFKDVNLSFSTSQLSVETKNNIDKSDIINKVKNIVNKYEPHVVVKKKDSKTKNKIDFNYKLLIRFFISLGLFVSALVFNSLSAYKLPLLMLAYIIIGYDILFQSLKNITKGLVFDENFLMSIATFGAIGIGEYYEAVAVMLFYQFGEYLQSLAVNKSRRSISNLMDIKSDYANKKTSTGSIKKVSSKDLKIGDTIIVKPGEKVPVDSKIIKGESLFDTVQLTGEAVLKNKKIGDNVLSGFINTENVLELEVLKEFKDSAVAKILNLVENSSKNKAETEKFITKFAKYYTPAVVLFASLVTIIPTVLFNKPFDVWFYRSLIFLVISCPCALVVSIPLSYFSGIGLASKNGILVKGGNFLEELTNIDSFVFDKTGTLTEGKFEVHEIISVGNYLENEILKYAAIAEVYSNHPIAKSIVNKYGKDIDESKVDKYSEIPGKGIKAYIDNKEILVGNDQLLKEFKIEFEKEEIEQTIIYVAVDNEYIGYLLIYDKIKSGSIDMLNILKNKFNKEITMLTGDNKLIAGSISKKLGIDNFYADLLPHQKNEKVSKLLNENKKVAFIGDGTNDAPVLKQSDVGISMGNMGSDAAIESSDIVIMDDSISKVSQILDISKFTKKIVYQNIVLALGTKLLVLFLGTIGYASMKAAIFADVGVALIAIFNSLRILNYK